MWILTPSEPRGETYYLLPGKEYVVGRKNCDILLPSDQSISRAHASLTVTEQILTLKDTSKYGTFVNNVRLTAALNLKSGDNITFGIFQSKFRVDLQKSIVCSSCLDSESKSSLSQVLSATGGKLVNIWTQECTHLTMPSVKVNIKTISALLCCRPIVKPEFFSELNNAVQQRLPLPKAESFIPEIDEPILSKEDVNLGSLAVRKQLFTGKTFVFLTAKQLKRLSAAVNFGGGRSQLLEEGSMPRDLLESPQSCVVEVTAGNSQVLLASSTTEWVNSVKSIVERSGLRVITESEIGFAAIYASCDKYCNPSCPDPYSGPAPNTTQHRIPSASLSQNIAVDETVLPAASQNITAYVVNTEPSQGIKVSNATEMLAVGETPEKKQTQNIRDLCGSKCTVPKKASQCIVADTMLSSYSGAESIDSQKKKPDSKLAVLDRGMTSQPSTSNTNGSMKTSFYKQSPQKAKISAQVSPQKQSTLTTFFQPVSKKRPLGDELSAVMSQPKRPVLESSITMQPPHTSARCEEMPSPPDRSPASVSLRPQGSATDLFTGRSDLVSEEEHSRKRKTMEEEIALEELESIMSLDIDFDEEISSNQKVEPLVQSSTISKQVSATANTSSSKRQRVHLEEKETRQQKSEGSLEKNTILHQTHTKKSEQGIVSVKTEQVRPKDFMTNTHQSSKPSASTSKNIMPFEEDETSYVQDSDLLSVDLCNIKEETITPLKPVIKQEVEDTKVDEALPKKLLLVEFRSLMVNTLPKTVPQPKQNSCTKNFKSFRKSQPGSDSLLHVIRGSDLLVHSRGKNSDLDEWLKDAAEEERQNKRDESVGDDLFRYNPTKLSKRR